VQLFDVIGRREEVEEKDDSPQMNVNRGRVSRENHYPADNYADYS